jgi:hypothetical protein
MIVNIAQRSRHAGGLGDHCAARAAPESNVARADSEQLHAIKTG